MNVRTKITLLSLLREFHDLAIHKPGDKAVGPSIFQTAHDPLLHDEQKECPHCRARSIVDEMKELIEKEPTD